MSTRRSLILSLPLLGFTTAAYAVGIEPNWFETVVQPVRIPGLKQPLRILHLSDIHASSVFPLQSVEAAIALALETKPDLICLTGDFVTAMEPLDRDRYAAALRRLSAAAPTFAVLGNDDGGVFLNLPDAYPDTAFVRSLLSMAQVTLLHNASTIVTVRAQPLRLTGLGDLWARQVDPSVFQCSAGACPTVVMAHNPDTKDLIRDFTWDLMLSGHTHGGQVLIPLIGTRYAPVNDKRFVAGLKSWNTRQIYVTRGVGSLAGVRFRCRPEITLLDLQPTA
jgi:predicted MPP superfamily phosphohydrolase